MNRETLDRWCERGILALVLGVLIYSPLAFGAARLQEFLVTQALTGGALGLWLARLWLNERPKFLFPPLGWAVVAFTGYAIGRYLTSDVEYVARQELLRILVYAALFFLVLNNLHRQESTQIIAFTLFGLAVAISFYAVFQFATKSDLVWNEHSGYRGRGSGTYICPNHLAGFLEMLLPLAVAYAIVGRGKALTRILLIYAGLAMLAGIAVTASRGSWVAASIALLTTATLLLRQRSFRIPALVLVVALLGGGIYIWNKSDFFQRRLTQAFNAGQVDMNTRLDLWDSAVRMWRDHVWFGVGPGHYDLRFRAYRPITVQLRADRAHNEYLNLLADWGVCGAIIVAAALLLLTWGILGVWKNVQRDGGAFSTNQSDKFAFVLGAAGGLLALALHSVVDFNLQIPANAIVAVTLMALLTSHWRFATERFWFSVGGPGRSVASAILVAGGGYLGVHNIRLARENHWLNQAARMEEFSLARVDHLRRAYTIEPHNGETVLALGEICRENSFDGRSNFAPLAAEAVTWYQRGITNNPHSSHNYLYWGMVLDFLGDHAAAEGKFLRANELDPNGYFTTAHVGRHYVESGQYAAARPWLERSLLLERNSNDVATVNLKIANERLLQAAQDPLWLKMRERLLQTGD